MTTLNILDRTGDMQITWNHDDPADRERVRAEVAKLQEAGYSFFLVDGSPADEIAAGQGTLIVKRLTAEELIEPATDEPAPAEPEKKRRGRPPKASRQAVAVRPIAGG